MQELRANTQIVVPYGPIVDINDGFTMVTTMSLSTVDSAMLIKAGGTTGVDISGRTDAAYSATAVDGMRHVTLTTSDTDTEGLLTIVIEDVSLALPIVNRYMVLSEAAWDTKYSPRDGGNMYSLLDTIARQMLASTVIGARRWDGAQATTASYSETLTGTASITVSLHNFFYTPGSSNIGTALQAAIGVLNAGGWTKDAGFTSTEGGDLIYLELDVGDGTIPAGVLTITMQDGEFGEITIYVKIPEIQSNEDVIVLRDGTIAAEPDMWSPVFNHPWQGPDNRVLLSSTDFLVNIIKGRKILSKAGDVWSLIVYDPADDSTPILTKALKDKDGSDITDLDAGALAMELLNSA
jgi:hypothetical protein